MSGFFTLEGPSFGPAAGGRPRSLVVLGAGVIAVEFASIFASLGAALLLLGSQGRDGGGQLQAEAGGIRIAHGQMRERELELAMRDFYQGRFNILLCTTIIETGIDIPTANTIIINRADRFGLAQLHQLRGRVGRSHHQAYAYLLLPDEGNITTNAKKRLEAIQAMEELGSGFYLAMHDLEIRGAGEVLGENQSGDMHEIGFNLYCTMLDMAVKSLKAGKEPDLNAPLFALLCAGVGLRQSSRMLGLALRCTEHKFRKIGRHLRGLNRTLLFGLGLFGLASVKRSALES